MLNFFMKRIRIFLLAGFYHDPDDFRRIARV